MSKKLMDWREYPEYTGTLRKIAELVEQTKTLEAAVRLSADALSRARSEMENQEALALIGDSNSAALTAARKAVDTAEGNAERDSKALAVNQRAIELLRAALPRIEADAKETARANVTAAFKAAVKKLRTALQAAAAANAAVHEIEMHSYMQGLPLVVMHWDDLIPAKPGMGAHQNKLSLWLHQAEVFLNENK